MFPDIYISMVVGLTIKVTRVYLPNKSNSHGTAEKILKVTQDKHK